MAHCCIYVYIYICCLYIYVYVQYCSVYFWSGFVAATNWCPSVKIVSFTLAWLSHDRPDSPQVSDTALSLKGVLAENQHWQCWLMHFILQTCWKMLLMCTQVCGTVKQSGQCICLWGEFDKYRASCLQSQSFMRGTLKWVLKILSAFLCCRFHISTHCALYDRF